MDNKKGKITILNNLPKGAMKHIVEDGSNGFTQEQLYKYGGRDDSVFTLTFRNNSDSYKKYGETISVCLVYSLNERKALEKDISALNDIPYVKATFMRSKHNKYQKEIEIQTKDIVEMIILHSTEENNTFYSKEKRTPQILEVPLKLYGKGLDVFWIYREMKFLKNKGIRFMPEDEARYLAYKIILDENELTYNEKKIIFDENGQICDNNVKFFLFQWGYIMGILNNKQINLLNYLAYKRYNDRVNMTNETLNKYGLNIEKLTKKHPEYAKYLKEKIVNFQDIDFNTTGKFPLYINFKSFLHIFFRHTEELNVLTQFKSRDKFQLKEKDIIIVMDIVMKALNDEYQTHKEKKPNDRFYRTGIMAFYYNGDYYNVDVDPDGRISTFYKGTGKD